MYPNLDATACERYSMHACHPLDAPVMYLFNVIAGTTEYLLIQPVVDSLVSCMQQG